MIPKIRVLNLTKHKALVLLLSLWTGFGWAQEPQETWELNTYLSSASKTYIARDQIKMTNNFRYVAVPGTSFSAKIDAGLLFPHTDKTYKKADGTFTNDPTQGAVVGSIPGQFAVSPTGAATYNIPIDVPAGINGMQPQFSINYSNQSGFGVLGLGWDIAGSSAITCGGKNMYFDGTTESIKLGTTDALYLDGQRLIRLSGTHFQVGAEYGTEVENYTRVKIAESPITTGIYFIVTTVDGKVMEYGYTSNSWVQSAVGGTSQWVLASKLNKVTDTYGNSITYTYSDNGHYLQKIEYAGQSVNFGYEDNTVNPSKSFIKDFLISQSKLLKTISVKSGTTTLKTYGFVYTSDNRLESIEESAADNVKVNSTTINWGQENSIQKVLLGTATDPWLNSQDPGRASMQFADINGDGHADRLEMWAGNSNSDGHITAYLYDNTHKTYAGASTATITFAYHDYEEYQPQMIASDINNDGKAEVIFTNYKSLLVYMFDNTTNSFTSFSSFTTTMIFDTYTSGNKIRLMSVDVNNDNFNDVILAYGYDNTEFGSGVFYGSQSGLLNSTDYFKSNVNAFKYLEAGDFYADNKIDIFGSRYSSSLEPVDAEYSYIRFKTNYSYFENSNNEYRNAGDLNGDGLTDILVYDKDDEEWYAYKNNGDFNLTKTSLTITNNMNLPFFKIGENRNQKAYFVDFNGDGLLDIIFTCQYVGYYTPAENINNSFIVLINKGNFVFEYLIIYQGYEGKISNLNTVSDINGDGIADFVVAINKNNSTTTSFNYDYFALTMPQANRRNLVASITNGMGQTVDVTYKNLSDYEAYESSEATANIRPLRSPLLLVNSTTQPDGSVTTYSFEKPKYHTEGKGFLGFTIVTSTNAQLNTKSISNYKFNNQYYFSELEKQSISTVSGTDDISITEQTNGVKIIDSEKKRFYPIVTEQTTSDILKGIAQTVNTEYVHYPYSLTQTVNVGEMTTITVTTFTGPENKIPFLPDTVKVTKQLNGDALTRKSTFNYVFDIANNKPYKIIGKTETVDPEDTNHITTVFSNYDSWGHPQNVSIAANNKTRASSLSYTSSRSSTGRFLQSETDALGETTNYNWNEITGLLDSKTDVRNRTTNYLYDKFGQLKETIHPNGIREVKVLQWSGETDIAGSQYYSYSQVSGQAPLIIWYDEFGREIQRDTYGLNKDTYGLNKKVCVNTEYYTFGTNKGRMYRISEPYFEGDSKTWAATYNTYDTYGRVKLTTTPVGQTTIDYNLLSTTITESDGTKTTGTKTTTINSSGLIDNVSTNDKSVSYTYWPSGLTKAATPQDGQTLSLFYNLQGNRIKIIDPDAGTVRNEYNGFGEMTKQVQLIHAEQDSTITINNYNPQTGFITSIDRDDDITTYTYDTDNGCKSRINSIEIVGQHKQTFSYDAFDRVTNIKEEIIGSGTEYKEFNRSNEFDALGRIKKEKYSSGYYTMNTYDQYSNLTEVKDAAGRSIWKINNRNALGQATSVLKGNKETTYNYDPVKHQATSIFASGIIDYAYGYFSDNNLQWRMDNLTVQREDFKYDGQKRLTNWNVTRNGQLTYNAISFDDNGNIQSKSDLGNFTLFYGLKGRPHALDSIDGVPVSFPAANLNVTYTDFKKINTLTEGSKYYELTYGVDDQRRKSEYYANGVANGATLTRFYVGDYEEELNASTGNTRKIHYLSGAIYIDNSNYNDSLYYTYSDSQGSIVALTDDAGNVKRKFAYDPWGKRRNPLNWNETDNLAGLIINRGYTGHEHLDAFGILNMNGRVYDPLTAQFFSPDPFVQAPDNWLNYNRYGYVFGNPLSYTDPSGYVSEFNSWVRDNKNTIITVGATIVVGVGVGILTGGVGLAAVIQSSVIAGAASGATSGVMGTALNGGSFGDCILAGAKGSIFGGMSGLVGGALGSIAPLGTQWIGSTIWGAAGGAGTQAFSIWISGGDDYSKLWQGALIGGLFGFASSEQFSNLIKGKDFASNDKVLKNFEAGKYNTNGFSTWQDAALDYFGFEGKYDPNINTPYTDPNTGDIYYNEFAFKNFDRLYSVADHEMFHKTNVLSGKYKGIKIDSQILSEEEWAAYMHNYKNQGLYKIHDLPLIERISKYGRDAGYYNSYSTPTNFVVESFKPNWWDFVYKIQRRY